ncbi:MAG TPA: ABC transporter permease [bacterium]|nr:ABC transporter permease [bacterium]
MRHVASRPAVPWVLAAAGGVLLFYLLTPFFFGIAALDVAGFAVTLRQAASAGAIETSVVTATVSTLLVILLGVPLAYLLARGEFRGKAVLGALVYLPLVIPPLVGGVLLLAMYGPYAPVGQWLGDRGVRVTDAWPGIVLAQTFVSAPYLVVASRVAFEAVDPTLERVSYALGKPPLATFFRVSLPLAWPGILAGVPLAWLRALGEFGATVMVAYHPYTLPVYLFVRFGAEGLRAALPVATILVLAGAVVLGLVQVAARHGIGRLVP